MPRGPLSREQVGVIAGAAGGLAITLAALFWPTHPGGSADAGARLALRAACDLAAAFWLAISIAMLANHRFFSARDIAGAGLTEASSRAKLLQGLVQNTLEQTVLAAAVWAAWLFAAAGAASTVVLCAGCFCAGRLLFFLGYGRGAAARLLGFALTFYPSVGLILASLIPAARAPGVSLRRVRSGCSARQFTTRQSRGLGVERGRAGAAQRAVARVDQAIGEVGRRVLVGVERVLEGCLILDHEVD